MKPDVPIAPTDATFLALSASQTAPMIAYTYTDHAGLRTGYVLAYQRTSGAQGSVSVSPESIGVSSPAFVYDYFNETGTVVQPGGSFIGMVDYNGSYYAVAPIGSSGIAFLGDADKFVSCGKKRIGELSDSNGVLQVLVQFAGGEKRIVLHLYSPSHPLVAAEAGSAGPPVWMGGGMYQVVVPFDPAGQAIVNFRQAHGQRSSGGLDYSRGTSRIILILTVKVRSSVGTLHAGPA